MIRLQKCGPVMGMLCLMLACGRVDAADEPRVEPVVSQQEAPPSAVESSDRSTPAATSAEADTVRAERASQTVSNQEKSPKVSEAPTTDTQSAVQSAAEAGDVNAQLRMAEYDLSKGDDVEAYKWLVLAAQDRKQWQRIQTMAAPLKSRMTPVQIDEALTRASALRQNVVINRVK